MGELKAIRSKVTLEDFDPARFESQQREIKERLEKLR